ncbi:MAG TPA: T9SS type A sorting domain-containing protein, partial [Bacteroidia bacterium]|nr:T9SS type A sorting domain-containing protein [Bacteroidia bacterium]
QEEIHNPDGSSYRQCVRFRITEPIWKLAKENPGVTHFSSPKLADDDGNHMRPDLTNSYNPNACTSDGSLQNEPGMLENNGPIVSFDANAGQGYVPLDPNGMIGSNYYVQTINCTYAVWNKTGTSKLAETDLSKLFGKFTSDDGDPVTMYDKFADRWILTEFQAGKSGNIDTMMFAVSVTNDPTGSFYLYYFCYDATETSDYPKYAIWADGYYQTCNCQPNDYVIVYDRTKMLAGNKAAGYIKMSYTFNPWNTGCGGEFYCPQMLTADGTLPPYGYPNYLFDFTDPNWGSSCGSNAIRVFKVAVNWTSKTGTIALAQTLTTSAFNSVFPANLNNATYRMDIDQPGSANYASLDASEGFFSYRIPYLRWASYNAAVMCNVVNNGTDATSGSTIAAVRWYELRQDTTTKNWSIYQQSTYAPDKSSRWCPAIAMDQNGSIGLQYSISNSTSIYPGLRYTGRKSCDALNTMTLAEGTAATGNVAANTSNRWGDYSHLSVDPIDGITFWGTSMYANSKVSGSHVISHIYSFQIPACVTTGIDDPSDVQAELTAYQSGNQLNVKGVKVPANENVYVELYDISGKHIASKPMTTNSGTIETSFNVSSLAKGLYFVRLGNDRFMRVVKVEVQ